MQVAELAEQSRNLYEHPKIAAYYARDTGLTVAESILLKRCPTVGKHVLDLGVGAGRTIPWLAPSAASYVGVDFSQAMIDICKARHPDRTILWGDARDLSFFEEAQFDFVFFSYNGIDSVGHADRERILWEIARVTRPGGTFAFSSHNLDSIKHRPIHRDIFRLDGAPGPIGLLKHCARIGVRLRNSIRNYRNEFRSSEYAVLTDRGHNLAFMSYHIGPKAQARQLAAAGFDLVEVLDRDGLPVTDTSESHFLHYVAQRNLGRPYPDRAGAVRATSRRRKAAAVTAPPPANDDQELAPAKPGDDRRLGDHHDLPHRPAGSAIGAWPQRGRFEARWRCDRLGLHDAGQKRGFRSQPLLQAACHPPDHLRPDQVRWEPASEPTGPLL